MVPRSGSPQLQLPATLASSSNPPKVRDDMTGLGSRPIARICAGSCASAVPRLRRNPSPCRASSGEPVLGQALADFRAPSGGPRNGHPKHYQATGEPKTMNTPRTGPDTLDWQGAGRTLWTTITLMMVMTPTPRKETRLRHSCNQARTPTTVPNDFRTPESGPRADAGAYVGRSDNRQNPPAP